MKTMKLLFTAVIVLSVLLIFGGEGFSASPLGDKPKVLRIGTSKEGTRGFTFGLALQKVVSPYMQKEGTRVLSLSTAGSEASVVLLSKGEIEIAWDSAFDLYLLAHNQDLWEKRKIPDNKKPQIGFFSTASLKYYVCRAELRPKINCLRDMINFRIALHPPGTSYYPVDMATFRALGIYEKGKKNMRAMDMSRYAEAFATGEADVCSPYGGVGSEALSSWAIELDRRVKIKYIPPSPEESEVLNKIPALPFSTQPINKTVWSQDIGTDRITGNASSYGMHFRPDLDPELVYKFMKIVYDRWDEVYATTTLCDAFGPGAKAKEVNTSLISSFVGSKLKLHPGAAKFYKEIKWWQDSWSKLLP